MENLSMHLPSIFLQVSFALLTFAATYFVFVKVLRQNTPIKKVGFWILWIIATPALYFILLKLFVNVYFSESTEAFSRELWLTQTDSRVQIVDDLLNSKTLDGKSKSEVINLLGDPGDNSYFQEDDNLVYYLGPERSFMGVDSEWLIISFEKDKVASYQIVTD